MEASASKQNNINIDDRSAIAHENELSSTDILTECIEGVRNFV